MWVRSLPCALGTAKKKKKFKNKEKQKIFLGVSGGEGGWGVGEKGEAGQLYGDG